MIEDNFLIGDLGAKIKLCAPDVQLALQREREANYTLGQVEEALVLCVGNMLDRIGEGLYEMFTSPDRPEFDELGRILEKRVKPLAVRSVETAVQPVEIAFQPDLSFGGESVFSGHKSFSVTKLAAMIEYISGKGHNIYKTNLNKLLFYADLSYFYLRGEGISGAVYYNRPFGPVTDAADGALKDLITKDRIRVNKRVGTLEFTGTFQTINRALTKDERKVIDWVLDRYGNMTTAEIVQHSHEEKAYANTEPNDKIAYKYAAYITYLPPRSFLD
jgi:hypothetical protein